VYIYLNYLQFDDVVVGLIIVDVIVADVAVDDDGDLV
jgi:hypothetical protein